MGMLSGAAPVGVVHCYLGCHLSGRRQGRNDAVDAAIDQIKLFLQDIIEDKSAALLFL